MLELMMLRVGFLWQGRAFGALVFFMISLRLTRQHRAKLILHMCYFITSLVCGLLLKDSNWVLYSDVLFWFLLMVQQLLLENKHGSMRELHYASASIFRLWNQ